MIVLDASALVDVVADQPAKDWVLDQLDGEQVLAPAHQLAEIASAVGRLVRADVLTHRQGEAALTEAASLRQQVVACTADHLRRALALMDRVRMLDGLYVAVAEENDATLVTTDARLARTDLPIEVAAP